MLNEINLKVQEEKSQNSEKKTLDSEIIVRNKIKFSHGAGILMCTCWGAFHRDGMLCSQTLFQLSRILLWNQVGIPQCHSCQALSNMIQFYLNDAAMKSKSDWNRLSWNVVTQNTAFGSVRQRDFNDLEGKTKGKNWILRNDSFGRQELFWII